MKDAIEEIHDLQLGPDGPYTDVTAEAIARRNELLRPLLVTGARLRVHATVRVGAGHRRSGLFFDKVSTLPERLRPGAASAPRRVERAALDEIIADPMGEE
jgi:hypothetical protein